MFLDILPHRHRMIVPAIEGAVHEFHLGHFMVDKKLQFLFHKADVPEPQTFIHRRETVVAGKRTSSAGFIVDDTVSKRD